MRHRKDWKWVLLLIAAAWLLSAVSAGAQTFCAPPSPPPQKEPPDKPNPACDRCEKNCQGSPCYVSSGIYTTNETDLQIRTAGLPLVMSRRYRSDRIVDGPLGVGWMPSITARVYYVATLYAAPSTYTYRAIVTLPTGAEIDFTEAGGTFTPPSTVRHTLVHNGDDTWTFTPERSRTTIRFRADGAISSMADEFGNTLTYTYDGNGKLQRVADSAGSGRYIDATWGADGRISMISDSYSPARQVKYYYDATTGVLTGVADPTVSSDPSKRSRKYVHVVGRFGSMLSTITDGWDRVISQLDWYPNGQLKSYTEGAYNDANPTASEGEKYHYDYFPNGVPGNSQPFTQKTDSLGGMPHKYNGTGLITDRATFDPVTGQPTRTVDEGGNMTDYTYDARGNVLTKTVRNWSGGVFASWTYTYDSVYVDKVATITGPPDWPSWHYLYIASGQPGAGALQSVWRRRRTGTTEDLVATYTYTSRGLLASSDVINQDPTTFEYNAAGDLTKVTTSLGVKNYTYDSLGRLLTITAPGNRVTTYAWDGRDRVASVTMPKPSPSSPLNFTITCSYDNYDPATGLVMMTVTDANGRTTQNGMDAIGNLRKLIDSGGNATTYSYQYNLLKSVRDANGNPTTFAYNSSRYLISTTYPDGKVEQYTRGLDGGLMSVTDRKGVATSYTYDPVGRLLQGPGVYRVYTGSLLTQDGEYTFTYDDTFNVLTEERFNGHKITYAYQQLGPGKLPQSYRVDPPSGVTEPSQTVTYNYGLGNRITTITWSHVPGQFTFSYNPDGSYDTMTFPNGQTRQYTYDGQGRITAVTNGRPSGIIGKYEYGYDFDWSTNTSTMLGQRTSVTVSATVPTNQELGTTKYFYDSAYRMTRAEYGQGGFEAFAYDAIGNRLSYQSPLISQTYTYHRYASNPNANSSRLKNIGIGADIQYDENGNALSSSGAVLGWDALNRLTSYATNTTFTYDTRGRRLTRTEGATTTKFIHRMFDLVGERTAATGVINDYLFAPGLDQPIAKRDASGNITYYSADALGSIVATTASSTSTIADYAYSVFGAQRSPASSGLFGYTGRESGPPGWSLRARYYDADRGRFLSEDPLEKVAAEGLATGRLRNPLRLDTYAYAKNSPAMFTDPFGLESFESPVKCVLGCQNAHELARFRCLRDFTFAEGFCAGALAVCVIGSGGVATPACILGYAGCQLAAFGWLFVCNSDADYDYRLCLRGCCPE